MSNDSFSERYGYRSKKDIQLENIDNDLRMRLFNAFYDLLPVNDLRQERPSVLPVTVMMPVWRDFFKLNADAFNYGGLGTHLGWIKEKYTKLEWFEIYDFLEFVASVLPDEKRKGFISNCNSIPFWNLRSPVTDLSGPEYRR